MNNNDDKHKNPVSEQDGLKAAAQELEDALKSAGSANGDNHQSDPTQSKAEKVSLHSVSSDENDKYKAEYLYLKADFDNFRKQVIKERSQYIKYSSQPLIVELLDVLDNFDRALSESADNSGDLSAFQKGLELILNQFKHVLTQFNVTEIPSLGVAFDPMIHEAISSEETNEVPEGHVSRVFKKAYKLHDRVIRPAQVIVARAKVENSPASTEREEANDSDSSGT